MSRVRGGGKKTIESLMREAKILKIPYQGLSYDQLQREINIENMKKEQFNNKIVESFDISSFIKKDKSTVKHEGTSIQDIIRLKYLLSKHQEECILIPNDDITRINYTFIWLCQKGEFNLYIPKSFEEYLLNKCKGKRFLIVLFNIFDECKEIPIRHANILIIDRKLKTVERFEPDTCGDETYKNKELDQRLLKVFSTLKLEYISPIDYCPQVCFQTLQLLEGDYEENYNKEIQYCTVWSLFYADLRLTYPDTDRSLLIIKAIDAIKDKTNLTNFIEDYAEFIIDQ